MNNLSFDLNMKTLMRSVNTDAIKQQMAEIQKLMGTINQGTTPTTAFGYGVSKFAGIDGYIPPQEASYTGQRTLPFFAQAAQQFTSAQQKIASATTEQDAKSAQKESNRAMKDLVDALKDTIKSHKDYNRIIESQKEIRAQAMRGITSSGVGLLGSIERLDPFGAYQNLKGVYTGGKALFSEIGALEGAGIGVGISKLLPFLGIAGAGMAAVGAMGVIGANTLANRFENQAPGTMSYFRTLNSLGMLPSTPVWGVESLGGYTTKTKMISPAESFSGMTGVSGGEVGMQGGTRGAVFESKTESIMAQFGKGSEDFRKQIGMLAPFLIQGSSLSGIGQGNFGAFNNLIVALNRLEATTGTAAEVWLKSAGEIMKTKGLTPDQTEILMNRESYIMGKIGVTPQAQADVSLAARALEKNWRLMRGWSNSDTANAEAIRLFNTYGSAQEGLQARQQSAAFIGGSIGSMDRFMFGSSVMGLSIKDMMDPTNPLVQQKAFRNLGKFSKNQKNMDPELFTLLMLGVDKSSAWYEGEVSPFAGFGGPPRIVEKSFYQGKRDLEKATNDLMRKDKTLTKAQAEKQVIDTYNISRSAPYTVQPIVTTQGGLTEATDTRNAITAQAIIAAEAKEFTKQVVEAFTVGVASKGINIINGTINITKKVEYRDNTEKGSSKSAGGR